MAAFLCLTWAFLWVPLCPSLPFQKDPVILDGGPACERPYLQMRSHSEALGVKTSAYEFGGGHSATLNSLPPTLYWGWGGEGRRDGLCTGDKDSTVEALMCWASRTRAVWAPVILLLCWGECYRTQSQHFPFQSEPLVSLHSGGRWHYGCPSWLGPGSP